jgi:hypothetical protein
VSRDPEPARSTRRPDPADPVGSPRRSGPAGRTRRLGLTVVVGALVAVGLGCSDDAADTTASSTSAPTTAPSASEEASTAEVDPEYAELCELAVEINEQDGPPSAEQLEAYAEQAPEDLRPAVESVGAAFAAAGDDLGAVFSDPEVAAALERITEFEATSCALGPAQDASVNELDPDAARVDVVASDYHFDADYPTEPGRYSFVITNEGEEPHLAILARLEDGVSVEDAMASEGEEGIAEMFESEVAPPGGETVITAELSAGNWILVCPIPDAEGTPHVALGMVHDFTVA